MSLLKLILNKWLLRTESPWEARRKGVQPTDWSPGSRGQGPTHGTLTHWMLVLLMLLLLSMRKMNSPWVFLRLGCTDWRSGQKLSMMTEWWGISLWRRFRMTSVWRRKEHSRIWWGVAVSF